MQVKGQRKISFDQFVTALGIIAEKRGQALKEVVQLVLQAKQPSVTGTKAGFVKFHDDKVWAPPLYLCLLSLPWLCKSVPFCLPLLHRFLIYFKQLCIEFVLKLCLYCRVPHLQGMTSLDA